MQWLGVLTIIGWVRLRRNGVFRLGSLDRLDGQRNAFSGTVQTADLFGPSEFERPMWISQRVNGEEFGKGRAC